MSLLADLEAFVTDHRPRGQLTGRRNRARLGRLPAHRGVPPCGVTFERWVTLLTADLLAARGERMSLVNAVYRIPCGRLPFESHNGVAQRRNRALPGAPLLAIALVYRAVGLATLQNHHHTWHTGEPLQEVLVEIGVVPAHHDEHLGIRK
jgi:hypothetical protein